MSKVLILEANIINSLERKVCFNCGADWSSSNWCKDLQRNIICRKCYRYFKYHNDPIFRQRTINAIHKHRANHKELRKKQNKLYYIKNRDRCLKLTRLWQLENRDYVLNTYRLWRLEHTDYNKNYHRLKRLENAFIK